MRKLKTITCPDCKQQLKTNQVAIHVRECHVYNSAFLKHTVKLSQYMNDNDRQFLLAEMDIAMQEIRKRNEEPFEIKQRQKLDQIIRRGNKQMDMYEQAGIDKRDRIRNPNKNIGQFGPKQSDLIEIISDVNSPPKINQEPQVKCSNCQGKIDLSKMSSFIYALQCLHLLCMECVKGYIQCQYVPKQGKLNCLAKQCKQMIPNIQIEQIIGHQELEILNKKLLAKAMGNLTTCVKCSQSFQFLKGNPQDAPKQDNQGKPIGPTKCIHYAQNRYICPNEKCKQEQCKSCGNFPYHLGMNCQQFKKRKSSKKCRYCADQLQPGYTSNLGIKAFDDICSKKECQQKTKFACAKIKQCKHSCYGYKNENQCLPCLKQGCAKLNTLLNGQNEDNYCSICYVDGLNSSPCVISKCGHIYHYSCLEKILNRRWLTPRIFFNFCHCPLCKVWIELPKQCPLQRKLQKYKNLQKHIQAKSIERLKYEGNDKDQRLTDPKSQYKDKPDKYAMAIYAYFQCFKCKEPYFGGRKNCAEAINNRQDSVQFKPQELICPKCCPVVVEKCPKHGKQFISFKCKFCCSVAQWFCWGNTHFCDQCHKKQCSGTYISKLPKDKLPKCQGPGKCPTGGTHGENGEQKSLGCFICNDYKGSAKDF